MQTSTDVTSLRASVSRARSHLARAGAADLELAKELDHLEIGLARLVGEETALVTRVREQKQLEEARTARRITLVVGAGVVLAVAFAVLRGGPSPIVEAPRPPVVVVVPPPVETIDPTPPAIMEPVPPVAEAAAVPVRHHRPAPRAIAPDQARAADPNPGSCSPPYWTDAAGRRHYRAACLSERF